MNITVNQLIELSATSMIFTKQIANDVLGQKVNDPAYSLTRADLDAIEVAAEKCVRARQDDAKKDSPYFGTPTGSQIDTALWDAHHELMAVSNFCLSAIKTLGLTCDDDANSSICQ